MVDSIIFDWGGVLAPSNTSVASKILAKQYGIDELRLESRLDKLEDAYSTSSKSDGYFKEISEEFGIPAQVLEHTLDSVPHNEVFDFAKKLKASGYKVYILSNQMKPRTDSIRQDNDLTFFSGCFFSNEIGYMKPQPEIFNYVLDNTNIIPDNCLFVDDIEDNILTANNLGFHGILFKNLGQLKQELTDKYNIDI